VSVQIFGASGNIRDSSLFLRLMFCWPDPGQFFMLSAFLFFLPVSAIILELHRAPRAVSFHRGSVNLLVDIVLSAQWATVYRSL